jgi:hypothetical protein
MSTNNNYFIMKYIDDKQGFAGSKPLVSSAHQLSLFYYDVGDEYSNMVELYNEIPKYVHDESTDKRHLESREREFKANGILYKVVLHPARIKIRDPKTGMMVGTKEMFIGTREEFVEDAITKIAIENKSLFELKDTTRVAVTVGQIQQELKRTSHSYSYSEIKEAIQVLGGARIILEDENGEAVAGTSTYPEFLLSTESQDGRGYVQLHPMVSKHIKEGLFRQINYELCMGFKSRYARRIFKQLSLRFYGATYRQPSINIYLKSFVNRHGFAVYSKLSDNAKKFRFGLDELIDANVIDSFTEEHKKYGRKIVDYTFRLNVHFTFTRNLRRANGVRKDVTKKLKERR